VSPLKTDAPYPVEISLSVHLPVKLVLHHYPKFVSVVTDKLHYIMGSASPAKILTPSPVVREDTILSPVGLEW
jgi:hypothetical protein